MKTKILQSTDHFDCATEQRLTRRLERFALTLLCIGLASTALTALTALSALAAQPGATPPIARTGPVPQKLLALTAPGSLTGLKAIESVEVNTPLTFNFLGSDHCSLVLDSGDGILTPFDGDLKFSGVYTYKSASMSSFESFKDYTASVTPKGNCKTIGAGPFWVKIRVVNSHPQGVVPPAQNNTMVVAGDGKLSIGMKPGSVTPPAAAATIASLVFANTTAGNATVLTVNGTGACKYHLSYVNLDAQGNTIFKPYPMITKISSPQSPFPMTMTLLAATPAGVYKWTANGFEGCTGTANATLTVQ